MIKIGIFKILSIYDLHTEQIEVLEENGSRILEGHLLMSHDIGLDKVQSTPTLSPNRNKWQVMPSMKSWSVGLWNSVFTKLGLASISLMHHAGESQK